MILIRVGSLFLLGCAPGTLTIEIGGKPSSERNWKEYFAQLVGTIVSLWDAAALDAAGRDGEVVPTFINLTDASIKVRIPA
jgi:hypothetical protein